MIEKPRPEHDRTTANDSKTEPILQLYRQTYVKVSAKILDTTEQRLSEYLRFASEQMSQEITTGDVIEHALKLLFERDLAFKIWLKQNGH